MSGGQSDACQNDSGGPLICVDNNNQPVRNYDFGFDLGFGPGIDPRFGSRFGPEFGSGFGLCSRFWKRSHEWN